MTGVFAAAVFDPGLMSADVTAIVRFVKSSSTWEVQCDALSFWSRA